MRLEEQLQHINFAKTPDEIPNLLKPYSLQNH